MGGNVIFSTTTTIGNTTALHAPQVSIISVYQAIATFFLTFQTGNYAPIVDQFAFFFKLISTFICLVFLVAVIYVIMKHHEFRKKEEQKEIAERGGSHLSWVTDGVKNESAAFGPFGAAFSPVKDPAPVASTLPTSTTPAVLSAASTAVIASAFGAHQGVTPLSATSFGPVAPAVSEDDAGPSVEDVLNMARTGGAINGNRNGNGNAAGSGGKNGSAFAEAEARARQASQMRAAKWQRVSDHSQSPNPNDWRLSILEGDVLLEELLDMKHAHGDTVSAKLKSMAVGDMPSIQKGWEAHLVRNRIAHDGSDFFLSQREARRIVGLYEAVLREGGYI